MDEARTQVAGNVLAVGRRLDGCLHRPKLRTVPRIGLPVPAENEPLTRLNGGQKADDGHGLAAAAHAQATRLRPVCREEKGDSVTAPVSWVAAAGVLARLYLRDAYGTWSRSAACCLACSPRRS